jgi:hypothetical protein
MNNSIRPSGRKSNGQVTRKTQTAKTFQGVQLSFLTGVDRKKYDDAIEIRKQFDAAENVIFNGLKITPNLREYIKVAYAELVDTFDWERCKVNGVELSNKEIAQRLFSVQNPSKAEKN